jgi:hypothetical protein
MTSRAKVALTVGIVVACAGMALPFAWRRFEVWAVGLHQRSVTHELSDWEREYSEIHNPAEANRAAEMLQYIQGYYVPGPGYRSDRGTEAALEIQRKQTLDAISRSLEEFTAARHGPMVEHLDTPDDPQQTR